MKALIMTETGKLVVNEMPLPTIHDNEVLLRVKACGLCKTDVDMFRMKTGAGRVSLPIIPGHEFSGIVDRIGASVKGLRCGDRVSIDPLESCGECHFCLRGMKQFCKKRVVYGTNRNGGMAEFCTVNYKQVYSIRSDLSFENATLAEPLGCCLHAIAKVNMDISKVEQVLIIGGGTMGVLLLQVLKHKGVKKIIVVEPNEYKRNRAISLGADASVFPNIDSIVNALECNNMNWVDVVFDCVSSTETIRLSCKFVRRCGEVILVGIPDAFQTNAIDLFNVFRKEVMLTGSCLNSYWHSTALAYLNSNIIKAEFVIEKTLPIQEIISVYNEFDLFHGKVIVTFN